MDSFLEVLLAHSNYEGIVRVVLSRWRRSESNAHQILVEVVFICKKVFNVTLSDAERISLGPDGKLTLMGNTVNVEIASWRNTTGDLEFSSLGKIRISIQRSRHALRRTGSCLMDTDNSRHGMAQLYPVGKLPEMFNRRQIKDRKYFMVVHETDGPGESSNE